MKVAIERKLSKPQYVVSLDNFTLIDDEDQSNATSFIIFSSELNTYIFVYVE